MRTYLYPPVVPSTGHDHAQIDMTTYQEWTSVAFEVARRKGLRVAGPGGQRTLAGGRSFTGEEPQAQLIRVIAAIWNDRKAEIEDGSRAQAREIAEAEISVSGNP